MAPCSLTDTYSKPGSTICKASTTRPNCSASSLAMELLLKNGCCSKSLVTRSPYWMADSVEDERAVLSYRLTRSQRLLIATPAMSRITSPAIGISGVWRRELCIAGSYCKVSRPGVNHAACPHPRETLTLELIAKPLQKIGKETDGSSGRFPP